MNDDVWVFGYGSLVWRPGFDFLEKRNGYIEGWSRRFYQGSTDHRGLPDSPGRVATLINQADAICWGVAYRLCNKTYHEVFDYLDDREKGGFDRYEVEVHTQNKGVPDISAHMYVADQHNANYLGPAPMQEMAQQINDSHGPSGSNKEYLLRLADSLRHMQIDDEHVFSLECLVKALD